VCRVSRERQTGGRRSDRVRSAAFVATDQHLWELLRTVAATGDAAWPTLLAELEPMLALFAKRQPIGRLRDREDTPREIVTRVFARLHAREFAAIKKLCALDPAPELRAWLRVLVRRSAIDYMREAPEFERSANRWVSLATLGSGAPSPDPDSLAGKRAELLSFVRTAVDHARREFTEHGELAFTRIALDWKVARIHVRRLVTRGEQYVAVLTAVLEGHSYPEVAERLAISRREVELTVRYLEELLRELGFGAPPAA
jgi:DNA-directed RNA polymerase specialized sigma24 family protein